MPEPQINDLLDDFVLDSVPQDSKPANKRKRSRREARNSLSIQMFRLDCELERIIED